MEQRPLDQPNDLLFEKLIDCQKLTLLGRLSSSLTHEINNHLAGVSGYAQLLLGQERGRLLEKELERINTSAIECKKLVIDFKRFARFNLQEKEFNSLNEVLKQVLNIFRRQFQKKNLQILEEYSASLPIVEVDIVALEQVFLNVIQNAFDALQEKGTRLSVATGVEKGSLFVVFEDDGPGFSDEAIRQLFVPFFTTKSHLHCAGLGLAASKRLLQENHGTIAIEALPAGGSRVKISLPLDKPEQQQGKT